MIGDGLMSKTSSNKSSVDGLTYMSIEQAKKTVENVGSWEEARLYARKRIADLKFSLKVFEKMIEEKKPWPGDNKAA